MPRWPSGAYFAASTAARASSAVLTCGTWTPQAPRSRNGAMISGLLPTGRTMGAMPLSSAAPMHASAGATVIQPGGERELIRDGRIDVAALWRHLGRPVVHSADGSAWALGTAAADRAAALRSLEAPDFSLPDRDGRLHSLSEQRGKKVLLVSWASW